MGSDKIKVSTARNHMIFMTDSSDHITGKAGLTLTITLSKDGAAFNSITPTVTDRGSGWYNLALTTAHTGTVGDLTIHVTSTGADPTDEKLEVVSYDPQSATNLGLSYISGSVALDSTVAKEGTINTKIPTALGFTGANVNAESKVTAAPTDMALNSNINTKIPTALGFTGANVNAESKVTAAPTDMATNTNINTKIPTALGFTGANVNAESKVTAAPTDMALNSNINTKIPTALSFTGANVNVESKVTAAPTDMALESDLVFLKRVMTNKRVWDAVNSRWAIYDDAGTGILYYLNVTTPSGGPVTLDASAIANGDKIV